MFLSCLRVLKFVDSSITDTDAPACHVHVAYSCEYAKRKLVFAPVAICLIKDLSEGEAHFSRHLVLINRFSQQTCFEDPNECASIIRWWRCVVKKGEGRDEYCDWRTRSH